jgi:hypothetical protein
MNETQVTSKYDIGYTYKAELVNIYGSVEDTASGCRPHVERKITEWVPLLMTGDSISFTRQEKE